MASMTREDLNQPVQTDPSILCMHMAQVTLHVMLDFKFIYLHCSFYFDFHFCSCYSFSITYVSYFLM